MNQTVVDMLRLVAAVRVSSSKFDDRTLRLAAGIKAIFRLKLVVMGIVRIEPGPKFGIVEVSQAGDLLPEEQRVFETHLRDLDRYPDIAHRECVRRVAESPRNTHAYRRQDVVSDAEWYAHPYVTDCRRPGGVDGVLYATTPLLDEPGLYLSFGLHRAWGEAQFSEEDVLHVRTLLESLDWLIEGRRHERRGEAVLVELSPRLRQTLACLIEGQTEKEAAINLGISPHTIHQYAKRIYKMLGASSRGELVARARDLGVTPATLRAVDEANMRQTLPTSVLMNDKGRGIGYD
ncbi:MAG: helix-turn-helix transcriptional regulator [Planctomycetota bacterium]|nr:helix-turn-helix transcriptional regulator [Planctomycetota bacterium]